MASHLRRSARNWMGSTLGVWYFHIFWCQKIECPFFVLSAQFDWDCGPAAPQCYRIPDLHRFWSFSLFQKNLLTKPANLANNGFWKFEKAPNHQKGGFCAVFGCFFVFVFAYNFANVGMKSECKGWNIFVHLYNEKVLKYGEQDVVLVNLVWVILEVTLTN